YKSYCVADEDCAGDTNSNSLAYKCDIDINKCACKENYHHDLIRDQWHESYGWSDGTENDEYLCKPLIGMKCSYGTVDETQCVDDTSFIYNDPYNYPYNSYVEKVKVNMCVKGFETDGMCFKIIGQNCSAWENTCDIVDYAYCNAQNLCSCKTGFTEDMGKCEPVIGMNYTNDEMCSSNLAWTRCMESNCSCIEGYVEVNWKCVSSAEREDICHQSICQFPDKYRRSPLYRLSPTELPVRDDLIEENWYDFGKHMLSAASSVTNTSPGTCGTKYPIYLKDEIHSADVVGLQFGESIEKTVQIGGLSVYGISKEFNVSIRNCSGSYFIFIKKAPISFSGYCVDT
ncbi:hypothetical protein DPMN_137355, partial [Dreissena polymorpha]